MQAEWTARVGPRSATAAPMPLAAPVISTTRRAAGRFAAASAIIAGGEDDPPLARGCRATRQCGIALPAPGRSNIGIVYRH
jgi:hypothetical protein